MSRGTRLGDLTKAVIPAAGLGTRLLPATKEMPKEMLPLFAPGPNGAICLKPVLHLILEQLLEAGFREFCLIVGRGKRAIEDYFTPDGDYVAKLRERGSMAAEVLERFYEGLGRATLIYVNQPEPRGFGDAVLRAKPFAGKGKFLVHAGDTYILSEGHGHLGRLIEASEELDADAAVLIKRLGGARGYGFVEAEALGGGTYEVKRAVEKPESPPSDLAIMPVYIFKPSIFEALEGIGPGVGGELQLTDGIQAMIEMGKKVYATELREGEERLDVGTIEAYWEALSISYEYAKATRSPLHRRIRF